MKTFEILCMKMETIRTVNRGPMIQTKQLLTTDTDNINFEVPAGFVIVSICEILPAKHYSKPDAKARDLKN
jgi:hypothetical protein